MSIKAHVQREVHCEPRDGPLQKETTSCIMEFAID